MLRANQIQQATSPCCNHHRGDMQPPLLRTLPRLSQASSTTPAAAAAMAAPSGTMPCWRVLLSVTHTMLRANQMQHATSPCVGHHRGDMQPPLLRTLPRLSDASSATPAAAAAMAVPSGTMPSWRVPLSVTQTMLRANQSNAAGNNPVMTDFVVATVQGPYQYIWHGFPHTAATCCPQQSQDGAMFWRPRTMHIRRRHLAPDAVTPLDPKAGWIQTRTQTLVRSIISQIQKLARWIENKAACWIQNRSKSWLDPNTRSFHHLANSKAC